MRYLVASDLHYDLRQLDWIIEQAADFDAVVLAGDHLDVAGRVDAAAQIAMTSAILGRLADVTTTVANSGNHDLDVRRADGEKYAGWLADLDPRVVTDGRRARVGDDLVSVCAWWEGEHTRAELERQLAVDAGLARDGLWIWVYHSPPDASPTSWGGSRHYGDDVLNRLIDEHRPDLVLTGHVHDSPFRAEGGWHDRIGSTLVVNAGRNPGPVPCHLIVDSGDRSVSWWSAYERGEVAL